MKVLQTEGMEEKEEVNVEKKAMAMAQSMLMDWEGYHHTRGHRTSDTTAFSQFLREGEGQEYFCESLLKQLVAEIADVSLSSSSSSSLSSSSSSSSSSSFFLLPSSSSSFFFFFFFFFFSLSSLFSASLTPYLIIGPRIERQGSYGGRRRRGSEGEGEIF